MALVWLAAAILAGACAGLIGWPAWRDYRARDARDLNAERYAAWRGRASRGPDGTMREGPTLDERRRFYLAGALAVIALVCLVVFFTLS